MDWPSGLQSVRRGAGIASRAMVARLREYGPAVPDPSPAVPGRFVVVREFGANPGRLRLRVYLPARAVRPGAPLIVLLHGCGQDAADFAAETGWTDLADRLHLPLLLPEQLQANNHQRCFHWFHLADTRRGHGEAASIAAMVAAMTTRFQSDRGRVFVAGASFAGLPVGEATSMVHALTTMAHGGKDVWSAEWVARALRVAPPDYSGAWPRLSIWQGDADPVVVPQNGANLAAQWRALHGVSDTPSRETAHHVRWGDAVELWKLPRLGHAWAIGEDAGRPSQFAVPGEIDAVTEIGRFWGIG